MVDELKNQLKSQNLETLKAASIGRVGGSVFPDAPASNDLSQFDEIVNAWQSVHVPTYGQPIAGTGQLQTIDSTGDFKASGNTVLRVSSMSVENSGIDLASGNVTVAGCVVGAYTVDPSLKSTVAIPSNLLIAENTSIAFENLEGTASDITLSVLLFTIVQ